MSDIAISVENLSKRYRLGQIGMTSLRETVERTWHRLLGRNPDDEMGLVVPPLAEHAESAEQKEIWALKDVSFEVERGEVLGIIGKNGAGKSTLLKILTRITEPTSGKAILRGKVASLLEVGTGFHPELTGRENVYLSGAILGMKKNEITDRFDEIIAFSEVEKFVDTPVKRYSSGMYVRLAFAVAAHLEPEILLIDEVLAVGDIGFQKKCLGKMEDVARLGRTVLFVSHNMAAIGNLCSSTILLTDGRIVEKGESAAVLERYLSDGAETHGACRRWDDLGTAPGNDSVRLRSVYIMQDGIDGFASDVDISKEAQIHIEYECLEDGVAVYVAIMIKDHLGSPLLASSNALSISVAEDPWYSRPHPRGLYHSVCALPANFLNDKKYSVTVILGRPPGSCTVACEEGAVTFGVHDTGEMRKEYYGDWFGIVRPRLAWATKQEQTRHR